MRLEALIMLLLVLFFSSFFVQQAEDPVCYWEVSNRTGEQRHPLNWIFEAPMFSSDPEKAAVQMAKYASLMGYDFIGTDEYNSECGLGSHGYWASNTMYGFVDWVDDPRIVCLRANVNEEFPCFISWRMGEERDPSTLTEEDKLRYLNGEFLSYWIDVQRDEVIDQLISALEEKPEENSDWDQVDLIYLDEFTSSGYSYISEDYELEEDGSGIEFRCHEFHEEGGVDGMGHDYATPEEGKLVLQARMKELAHTHGVKIAAGAGGTSWFLEYLPYIYGEKPESEWPYEIPLERYRAAEPDYFVIEADLGDPGTQQFEWSLPDYTAAEAYSDRVYAGSPRPHIKEIGVDSEKNIYTVEQVIFRAGYLASKGFWFGPNSESMDAVLTDPGLGKKTAVKPFLKAIPNWENLNKVPLEKRSFDNATWVYESPLTRIDKNVVYSKHPFTGDFHVVFMDPNASCPFSGDWDEYNVYRTSSLWEREEAAKEELVYANGSLRLKDPAKTNTGYVVTKNSYKTIKEVSLEMGTKGIVVALRTLTIVSVFLVLAVFLWRRSHGSRSL